MRLAREIVSSLYDDTAAAAAEEHFRAVFQQREVPADLPTRALDEETDVVSLLVAAGLAGSRSQARRLVEQGGVRLDGETVTDPEARIPRPRRCYRWASAASCG